MLQASACTVGIAVFRDQGAQGSDHHLDRQPRLRGHRHYAGIAHQPTRAQPYRKIGCGVRGGVRWHRRAVAQGDEPRRPQPPAPLCRGQAASTDLSRNGGGHDDRGARRQARMRRVLRHPGVFAWAPHRAIKVAREEGYAAHMEPGISSEDCLYADLGIDPGKVGCQHFDTTQFMLFRRNVDPSAWLILWQVGLAGEQTGRRFATGPAYRQVLVDVLLRDYPADHEVTVYRAATLPMQAPRMESLPISGLPDIDLTMSDTLAVPPCRELEIDFEIQTLLGMLDVGLDNVV